MSQALYEQYKDALRRGHVAALRGRLEVALTAYESAAAIAPDRALPHASMAAVLRRLGRVDAAEVAYAAALQRAPGDETALLGRAELRAAVGNRLDAARDFEALADSLERAGRLVDACDAARRALELAESRSRRHAVERLAGLLRDQDADPSVAEALRLALQLLEPMRAAGGTVASPGGAAEEGAAATEPVSASPPGEDIPAEEPPLDVTAALLEAEALLDARDVARARPLLLALAGRQRALGHLDAALDACLVLMTIDPSDTELQLEVAANQQARGWSGVAAEKVRLLGRLAELDADAGASEAIAAFATRHGFAADQQGAGTGSGDGSGEAGAAS